jgi:hypothetical protein
VRAIAGTAARKSDHPYLSRFFSDWPIFDFIGEIDEHITNIKIILSKLEWKAFMVFGVGLHTKLTIEVLPSTKFNIVSMREVNCHILDCYCMK